MKKSIFLFTVLILSGCSKSDDGGISFNETNLSMYANDTHQLFKSSEIKATSSNDFVASVSSNGVVTANHVGTAQITAGDAKCNVTVKARYNTYKEPYLDWGASLSSIKTKAGTPASETTTSLVYKQSSTVNVAYTFTNDKLTAAGVSVSTSYTTQLSDFLFERYQFVSMDDDYTMFIDANTSSKAKTVVGVKLLNVNYWMVAYAPYPSTRVGDLKNSFETFQDEAIKSNWTSF